MILCCSLRIISAQYTTRSDETKQTALAMPLEKSVKYSTQVFSLYSFGYQGYLLL